MLENIPETFVSFMYIDKNPEMKLVSYLDIKKTAYVESFIEEAFEVESAA